MSDALLPPAAEPLAIARERAIRLLTDRYADDTLSTAEFERRLDRLYATAGPSDADALVADLQVARPPAGLPAQRPAPVAAAAGSLAQRATRRLLCVMGQRTVAGRWTAPPRLEVRAVLSEVVLDLRDATFPEPCEIDVLAVLGSVHILLPPNADVESQMGAVMGEVTDGGAVGVAPLTALAPVHLRLTGTSTLAEVVIRRAPPNLPPGVPHKQAWKASKPPR